MEELAKIPTCLMTSCEAFNPHRLKIINLTATKYLNIKHCLRGIHYITRFNRKMSVSLNFFKMTLWYFIHLLKTHAKVLKLRRCQIYFHKLDKESKAYKSYSDYVLMSEWKFSYYKENVTDLKIAHSFMNAAKTLEKVNRRLKIDLQDWNINRRSLAQVLGMICSISCHGPFLTVDDVNFRILDFSPDKSLIFEQSWNMNYLSPRTNSDIQWAPREHLIMYSKTVFARILAIWLKHDCKVINNYNTWCYI